MLGRIVRTSLIGTVVFLAAYTSRADGPGGVLWGPEFQAIQDAARIADPGAREAALRQTIRKGLLEVPPEVANLVLGYLGDHSRWLDLRPFEDLITEYGRSNNPTSRDVGSFLDSIELPRMSRDERLRLYTLAIVDGSTTLRHGWTLVRQSAVLLASDDGVEELKPLIEAHYADLSPREQRNVPLPEILIRLDLGAGAADREGANRLASARLAAMKDADFRNRMNTDEAFRTVVDGISTYVCGVDPYRLRRNPGCASIKDIVKRQLRLEKTTEEAARATAATPVSSMQRYEEHRDSWLGRMEESSAGEPSARF